MVLFRNVLEGPSNSVLQVAVKNNPTGCVVLHGQNSTASICCRMERATVLEVLPNTCFVLEFGDGDLQGCLDHLICVVAGAVRG